MSLWMLVILIALLLNLCNGSCPRSTELEKSSICSELASHDTYPHTASIDNSPLKSDDIAQIPFQRPTLPRQHDISIEQAPWLEVEPLIVSGPVDNRNNLVFFADGYTQQERGKFFADALRLAWDISRNQTVHTVQPLLNFWAVYTPSHQSGLGIDGPGNTPFGLYRIGTELRGVYVGRKTAAKAACSALQKKCDIPIFLGNDPRYGGIGGSLVTITSSILNGPLVLRHELGHRIIQVGEEYDGGDYYYGQNAAHSVHNVPWSHWLSNTSRVDEDGNPRVERAVMVLQAYPWTLLQTTDPWISEFTSSGSYHRYSLQFSISGIPEKDDLRVTLSGEEVAWTPQRGIGDDRWFYNLFFNASLPAGRHQLKFELINQELQGKAQLCSAEILEFGTPNEFIAQPGFYGLYPTLSYMNKTSYRPTNADCLMRAVTHPNFCNVCLETLWLHLLRRVSLIDDVRGECVIKSGGSTVSHVLKADLISLASLRKNGPVSDENYSIRWFKDGSILDQYTNQTVIELEKDKSKGVYTVSVLFSSSEIRVESKYLTASRDHWVQSSCP